MNDFVFYTTIKNRTDVQNFIDGFTKNKDIIPIDTIENMMKNVKHSGLREYFSKKCEEYNGKIKYQRQLNDFPNTRPELLARDSDDEGDSITDYSNHDTKEDDIFYPSMMYASVGEIEYDHPSRIKPKYGYARNLYGDVQKRDQYRENQEDNPYQDNCTYDNEDDNDSMYMLFD